MTVVSDFPGISTQILGIASGTCQCTPCVLCRPMHNAQVGHTQTALSCTCFFNLFEQKYKKVAPDHPSLLLNLALLVHKEMWEDTGSLK